MRAAYDLVAPAKLNLDLRLVGRRADGYHLLRSTFVLIDWADTLHVERRDDGRMQRHDLGTPLPADDLCLRAARALQSASGTRLGADISIDKRLPSGAGMGGGSSDAATTLLALNRLWRLHWPRERLLPLALALGADVPFFVGGRNAQVEGIGEQLTPLDLPLRRYAVVKPAASLATAEIFRHPLTRAKVDATLAGSLARVDQGDSKAAEGGRNDLEDAAREVCPEVSQAARWLEARYGNSRMTGSGSAVFATVLAREGTVEPPKATVPTESLPEGWVGRMCQSLPCHPLIGWAS